MIATLKTPMSYFERVLNLVQNIIIVTKFNQWFGGSAIEVMQKKFGPGFDVNVSAHFYL